MTKELLVLEVNEGHAEFQPLADVGVHITPPVGEDYWLLRVWVSDTQAVLGFAKFGTIGIGFLVEDDWNTNLPFACTTDEIFDHIDHNKGDDSISDADCKTAIQLVREAAARAKGVQLDRVEREMKERT